MKLMLTATLSVNSYEKTNQDKLVQKLFCKSLSEANDCPKKATKKELNKKFVLIFLSSSQQKQISFLQNWSFVSLVSFSYYFYMIQKNNM